MIQAIAFDAFGTLCRITTPLHPYRMLFEALGCDRHAGARLAMSSPASVAELAATLAPAKPINQRAFEAAIAREAASVELFPEAPGVLAELARRGLKLAVISNLAPAYARALDPLLPAAMARVWSWDVGALKPDQRIFTQACARLDCPPEAVLMIGDRVEDDVLGARDAGLHALHLDRGLEPGPLSLRSLTEVLERYADLN